GLPYKSRTLGDSIGSTWRLNLCATHDVESDVGNRRAICSRLLSARIRHNFPDMRSSLENGGWLVASFFLEVAFWFEKPTAKLLNDAFYAIFYCQIKMLSWYDPD